ncbi:MAG TPA: Na+/H+ antiporter NhaA [Thermoleophilaceae bacterium]|nr:Na+/H+ antiporter NhaA [Thermoleophilaceae bacterium]
MRSDRALPRLVVRPLERFLQLEAGSAALLMAAALVGLVWINASQDSYEGFWTTAVTVDVGPLAFDEDLRHLVNDLLMAVFFYVVALEVKREALFGSLRDPRSAAVPIAAAVGTMVGAAVTYVAINLDGGALHGWAIPIATDIAFALGALGLAGRRAPRELRAFLLTLAIVDDIGTIAVIAVFYSDGVGLTWLAAGVGALLAVLVCRRVGVRSLIVYVALAGLTWIAALESGIHPTLAGVALGFLTPAVALHARDRTGEQLGARLAELTRSEAEISEAAMLEASRIAREAVSPLSRMEALLHPWTAYTILPIFALANAGVPVSLNGLEDALTSPVGLGILLGLVVGAPIGGVLLAWLLVRFGPARIPDGLDWPAISALAPLKGIGFTVAIFISVLAFDEQALQDQAKLAILVASAVAALIGLIAINVRFVFAGADSERPPTSR